MTREELKQDFESALIKHVHFKSRLRSYLFGNGQTEGPLRDPEQCGFGQWLALRARGTGPYAHLPEAHLLDQAHIRMHQEANRLMDLHRAGHSDEATSGMAVVQQLASEMVTLMGTMQEKLRTGS